MISCIFKAAKPWRHWSITIKEKRPHLLLKGCIKDQSKKYLKCRATIMIDEWMLRYIERFFKRIKANYLQFEQHSILGSWQKNRTPLHRLLNQNLCCCKLPFSLLYILPILWSVCRAIRHGTVLYFVPPSPLSHCCLWPSSSNWN